MTQTCCFSGNDIFHKTELPSSCTTCFFSAGVKEERVAVTERAWQRFLKRLEGLFGDSQMVALPLESD